MDEIPIHFTIKPKLIERIIFLIIIVVLAVLLVLKTVNTPEPSVTTTTIPITTTVAGATTTAAATTTTAYTGSSTTSTTHTTTTTTTTAASTAEFVKGFLVSVDDVTYVTLNASSYNDNEEYVDARRKLTAIKFNITNNYITDAEVRAQVYFYSSQDMKDADFNPKPKTTLTIPNIKSGETKTLTELLPGYIFLVAYEQTLTIDIIPRAGLGEDVMKTITYKFRAK